MTGRAAPEGAPATMRPDGQGAEWGKVSLARPPSLTRRLGASASLRAAAALLLPAALLFSACNDGPLRRVDETYEVVGGQPQVDPASATIDRRGDAKAGDFASSSPVQVDAFVQQQVAKVDILWVIDNSGSMSPKQEKVKQNFQAFVAKLAGTDPPVDYHIGVVTTDTYNPAESGKLQNKAALRKPWVGPDTCVAPCNPVSAFRQNADVGIQGSGDEKGLLAASMAVSAPLTARENAGFLRSDAALFVIVISDEEDSSCSPTRADQAGGCTDPLQYGSSDYYARFFEGLKGYGRKDFVTVSAIAAVDQNPIAGTHPAITGCVSAQNPAEHAQYAPRYLDVARRSGGIVTSICDDNYLPALTNLGFLATGAKSTFLLSRAPYPDQLKVYVTAPGGQRELKVRGRDWEYRPCTGAGNQSVLNAIEFLVQNNALPPSSSTIEVEYPVNVRGVRCP